MERGKESKPEDDSTQHPWGSLNRLQICWARGNTGGEERQKYGGKVGKEKGERESVEGGGNSNLDDGGEGVAVASMGIPRLGSSEERSPVM